MSMVETAVPDNIEKYTDKYFTRTRKVLEHHGVNPHVSVKVFARGEGIIPESAREQVRALFDTHTVVVDCYFTDEDKFSTKEPLMIVEGPAQHVAELETIYLGILSHELTVANTPGSNGYVDTAHVRNRFSILDKIYGNRVSMMYFGARHYHWSIDHHIASAAVDGGAVATSTDNGSRYALGEDGVGTIPHFLVLVAAYRASWVRSPIDGRMLQLARGRENGTVEAIRMFDEAMPEDIPRVALVDTFNHEIDDSLAVCEYFEETYGRDWKVGLRIDTCGENRADGTKPTNFPDAGEHVSGTGVTVNAVRSLNKALIDHEYRDNVEIIVSSGMGDLEKAFQFAQANREFEHDTGYKLFSKVGIGGVHPGVFCTADIYAIEGEPMAKTGREIDPEEAERFKEDNMSRVI